MLSTYPGSLGLCTPDHDHHENAGGPQSDSTALSETDRLEETCLTAEQVQSPSLTAPTSKSQLHC